MDDFLGGISQFGGLSGDPFTPAWQAFGGDQASGLIPQVLPGTTSRYTSRYGTLMQSYEQRSRQQARIELRSHMLQFESERMMSAATAMLNSGALPLSDQQRQTLQSMGTSTGAKAAAQMYAMSGLPTPFDSVNAAVGLESAIRYRPDPLTGGTIMNADRRAKIAAAATADLYRPGQGRVWAGGLTGDGVDQLSHYMAKTGGLTGSAEIQNEMTAMLRTPHEMMPGQPGARSLKPGQAERLAEIYNLNTLQAAASDASLPEEEIKKASEEYEKAMNLAIGKRFAENIRSKAKSVNAVQAHYKSTTGQDISAVDAAAIADGITSQIGRLDGDRAAYVIDRLSGISTAIGLTPEQMQGAAARGRQMLDNFGMQGTRAGGDLAIFGGNRVSVMTDNGMFTDGNETFGFGTQEEELMKAEMMGASYLHSGVNRSKMAMMRMADMLGGSDNLKDGAVKSLLQRVDNNQTLTDADYALLENPDAVVSAMAAASGDSLSESSIQEMIDSDINFREQIHNDPLGAMAGLADMQAEQTRRKLAENMAAVVDKYDNKNQLAAVIGKEDQLTLNSILTGQLEQLNTTELKLLEGEDGSNRMIDLAKTAAIKARDAGKLTYDNKDLDQIAHVASIQTMSALGYTTTQMQQTSNQATLAMINRDSIRGEYRKERVAAAMQDIEEQARQYSGETSISGVMTLLEGANMDGSGVDMAQVGAALLSGASDNAQADLYRSNRDAIRTELDSIKAGKQAIISSGSLSPEQIERMEDDIAIGDAIKNQLDAALQYDEGVTPKETMGQVGKAQELGPGGSGSGSLQMSNVTIVIGDETIVSNGSGKGKYGGKNAVPTTQVN